MKSLIDLKFPFLILSFAMLDIASEPTAFMPPNA
jgi:hypothetical protein